MLTRIKGVMLQNHLNWVDMLEIEKMIRVKFRVYALTLKIYKHI